MKRREFRKNSGLCFLILYAGWCPTCVQGRCADAQSLVGFVLLDRSKLVDGRIQVQTPDALVDLVVRSFPWFSSKFA